MRAHQKDSYFESLYRKHIQDAVQVFKGQRFINTHPEEIGVFSKFFYLALTTLIGARTLGEEYVDIIYVNRTGKRIPKLLPRLGFVLSYSLLPFLVTRLARRYCVRDATSNKNSLNLFLTSYTKILDTLMNLHIAIFYFKGNFYSLSKRIFGLRYAFGHNKDTKKLKQSRGDYSLLGAIILFQFIIKGMINLNHYLEQRTDTSSQKNGATSDIEHITSIAQLEEIQEELKNNETTYLKLVVDLSDSKVLPYLPENSRSCMLCLSLMKDPSAANCGHIFCWECIVDWIREHPECPLCRQRCKEQNLLPLR